MTTSRYNALITPAATDTSEQGIDIAEVYVDEDGFADSCEGLVWHPINDGTVWDIPAATVVLASLGFQPVAGAAWRWSDDLGGGVDGWDVAVEPVTDGV